MGAVVTDMADKDKQPVTAKQKRLVKNPETFRERAVKASTDGDQAKRSTRVKTAVSGAINPVSKPVGQAARNIVSFKPLRPLFVIFRLLGKILFLPYFRNSWRELRQVTWPSWRISRRLTYAVLIFAIIFGALIASVDLGLDKLFRNILLK
jgi:preprotein translocase SecE subunit